MPTGTRPIISFSGSIPCQKKSPQAVAVQTRNSKSYGVSKFQKIKLFRAVQSNKKIGFSLNFNEIIHTKYFFFSKKEKKIKIIMNFSEFNANQTILNHRKKKTNKQNNRVMKNDSFIKY